MFFTESAARRLIDVIDVIDHAWRPIDTRASCDTARRARQTMMATAAAVSCAYMLATLAIVLLRPPLASAWQLRLDDAEPPFVFFNHSRDACYKVCSGCLVTAGCWLAVPLREGPVARPLCAD
jgi:hypothetical protein